MKFLNPTAVGDPPRIYTQGVLVEGAVDTLYISGQVGMDASGAVPDGFAAQARLAWCNVEAVLRDAGMSLRNVVKTTTFLVSPEHYQEFAQVRKEVLAEYRPASTLVYVSGLVLPALKVEIEVIAVKRR